MWNFFSKLLERQTLVLLILGAAFTLVFVFHGVPGVNWTIPPGIGIWLAGCLSALFITFGIISFLGLQSKGKPSGEHLKKEYNIKITSHNHNDSVPSPIELRGTFKKPPKSGYVFAVERNDSRNQCYVKNELVFYNNNTWHTQVGIGNGDNLPRTLIIAYFGEDSKRLFDYYIKVRDEKGLVGIKVFPSDFHPLAEVTIKLQKPQS